MGYRRTRLQDMVRALRLEKEAAQLTDPEAVRQDRDRRVAELLRDAAAGSAAWRDRIGAATTLEEVPVLEKAELMERYDELVTDPRLRREALLAHVAAADRDELHLGRYRVMATSGSSGLKGLFTYDREAWSALMSAFLRTTLAAGNRPKLPRRRIAFVGPSGGAHMSRRMASTADIGIHRYVVFPATRALSALVEGLNAYRPDTLAGFPSMLTLLAQEQRAGRLRIRPDVVTTSSELRTPQMAAEMEAAWGVHPHDFYAMTEAGIVASECERHDGMHVYEDRVVLEPDGDRVLVTSLVNRVQPTLRLAVGDLVELDPDPCPCGSPFQRIRSVAGRADDVLHIQGVTIHPMQFAPVSQASEVREFQVVQRNGGVRVRVALHAGSDVAAVRERLARQLSDRLAGAGVGEPHVDVEVVERLERDPAHQGKLKLVVAHSTSRDSS